LKNDIEKCKGGKMKGTYDKKENADRARIRTTRKVKNKMCPVFKKKCFGNECQSYSPGNVYQTAMYGKPTIWRLMSANCSNAIVNGYVEMEMVQP